MGAREQTKQILEQGTTDGVLILDRPVVLFTVTGAKSGQKRYVPLMRVEKDGRYAMIGSIGGSPKNPSWVYNLRANPKVTVQDGDKVFKLTAREVHGAEREDWWQRGTEAYPHYIELAVADDKKDPRLRLGVRRMDVIAGGWYRDKSASRPGMRSDNRVACIRYHRDGDSREAGRGSGWPRPRPRSLGQAVTKCPRSQRPGVFSSLNSHEHLVSRHGPLFDARL